MSDAPKEAWVFPDFNDHFSPVRDDWTGGTWTVKEYTSKGATRYVRADIAKAELDAAVKAEREACAQFVSDEFGPTDPYPEPSQVTAQEIAAAIRERGE